MIVYLRNESGLITADPLGQSPITAIEAKRSTDLDIYVTPDANLPLETYAAREAQRALFDCALDHPNVLGPDGKVLLGIRETENSGAIVEFLNISTNWEPSHGW